jgi:septum formation protein
MLSGSSHQVITALALLQAPSEQISVAHDVTSLKMARLSDDQIEQYLDTGPWQGKAGAYAIQEDDAFITSVDGSFSNVVGLPMEMLERMLEQFLPAKLLREFRI